MELTGKVIYCSALRKGTSQRTGKEWQSFEFAIQTQEEQYPRKACFEIFGEDRVQLYGHLCDPKAGKLVRVQFDIDANEYKGRYYNQLNCWKLEEVTAQPAAQPSAPQPAPTPVQTAIPLEGEAELPF